MRRRFVVTWCLAPALLAVVPAPARAGPAAEGGRDYAMVVESALKMRPPKGVKGKLLRVDIWARIGYAVDRRPDAVRVTLRSEDVRVRQNGRTMQETQVTRARLLQRPKPGAPFVEVPYGQAPEPLQQHLRTFGTPVVEIGLNAHGHEVGRKVLIEGHSADTQVGLADTLLSVHGPFPDDVTEWTAPAKIALGQGRTAAGDLRFTKAGRTGDTVKVKVSGRLRVEGVLGPGKIKSGTYDVTGEETWDARVGVWTSARWSVAVLTEVATADDQPVGQAEGTLVLTMGRPQDLRGPTAEADKARAGTEGEGP